MEEKSLNDLRNYCLVLYVLYAISAVLQFSEALMLMGIITLLVAYVATGARKKAAIGTTYASHLRWMLRTFWIGTGVIVPVAVLIATGLILHFTDILGLADRMSSDDPEALAAAIQNYMQLNGQKITLIMLLTVAPSIIWWLRRCWVGYARAKVGQEIKNVTSWL